MKNIILTGILLSVIAVSGFAQRVKEGTLSVLKNEERVNMQLDFSKTSFVGMDEEMFSQYEQDWKKDKGEVVAKFIVDAYTHCKRIVLGSFKDTEYTFVIRVISISKKGDFLCHVDLVNKAGERKAHVEGLEESGGRFGSLLNLIKDGAMHTGEGFGEFVDGELEDLKPKVKRR